MSGFAQLARLFHGMTAAARMLAFRACWCLAAGAAVRLALGGAARTFIGSARAPDSAASSAWPPCHWRLASCNSLDLARAVTIAHVPADVTFLAPVQQAGQRPDRGSRERRGQDHRLRCSSVTLARAARAGALDFRLAVRAWANGRGCAFSAGRCWRGRRCGCPNGAPAFFCRPRRVPALHVVIPALAQLWRLPRRPQNRLPAPGSSGAAPAATALIVGGLLWLGSAPRTDPRGGTGGAARIGHADTSASKTSSRWPRRKSTGRRRKGDRCRCCSNRRC